MFRGAMPFMGFVVLADNDGRLPSKDGWEVTAKYGQGTQRYWIEKVYKDFRGAKPGYSTEGYAHYTLDEGYVATNQTFFSSALNAWCVADKDGKVDVSGNKMFEVIEKYLSWAVGIANDDSHGYSQIDRWGPADYDCSSLVITALRKAGLDTGSASWTGNMRSELSARGWSVIRYNGSAASLQRGDILLHDQNHTEFYLGNNQRVGAHEDENHGIGEGAKPGDQTGEEICIRNTVGTWFTWVLRLQG